VRIGVDADQHTAFTRHLRMGVAQVEAFAGVDFQGRSRVVCGFDDGLDVHIVSGAPANDAPGRMRYQVNSRMSNGANHALGLRRFLSLNAE
jgi:hypothetical protein